MEEPPQLPLEKPSARRQSETERSPRPNTRKISNGGSSALLGSSCESSSGTGRAATLYESLQRDYCSSGNSSSEELLGGGGGGGAVLGSTARKTSTASRDRVGAAQRRIGFYKLRRHLGAGNFSKVKLGVHLLTNECVAVKVIDKTVLSESARHLLSQEITCMRQLDHPNLIYLFEVVESFSVLHVMMEYAGQGTLQAKISSEGPYPEEQARHAFAQLAAAIHYMHRKNIVHRDIKAENIFLTDTALKLGDFGFSTLSHPDHLLHTFCGSIPYAAPELLSKDSYLGRPVDVWASGVTLYFMLSGRMPFSSESLTELKSDIVRGEFARLERASLTCETFVRSLLCTDASRRFKAHDLLSSAWLLQGQLDSRSTTGFASSTGWGGGWGGGCGLRLVESPVDREIVEKLQTIGLPMEGMDFREEPRNATLGTYRILFHRQRLEAAKAAAETVVAQAGPRKCSAATSWCASGGGGGANWKRRPESRIVIKNRRSHSMGTITWNRKSKVHMDSRFCEIL